MAKPSGPTDRSILVVGASRGLGLGLAAEYLARGWRVVGTIRGSARTGLHDLVGPSGGRLEIERLDVTAEAEIASLRRRLAGRRFDVLFAVAGVGDEAASIAAVSTQAFNAVMETNALGPMRAMEAMADLTSEGGVIAAMSSGLGSIAGNESGGWEVYRASKAALNMMLRSLACGAGRGRACVAVSPGWVRTDMGGPHAPLSVAESARGIADTLAGRAGKPGAVFLDYRGRTLPW